MKQVMMLVAVVGGIVQMAVGADTHDYSNYARLKGGSKNSVTVVGGRPSAANWDPEGEMLEDGYYMIASGWTLTTKTGGDNGVGGTWPMAEMAIAGKFAASASSSRDDVAITPRLALCAGGTIALSSAYGTIKGDTLDIRGTADNPSLFTYGYTSANDKPRYYAQVLSTLTASDPDALVKFTRTATDGWDLQRAYRVKGFSNYRGSVIVEGEHTWLRPETSATEFSIGGTLELKDGGNLYIDTVSPKVGTLKVGVGSTVQVVSGQTIAVTDTLEIEDGASFCAGTFSPTVGTLRIGSGATLVLNGGNSIAISNALEIADDAVIAVSNVAATAIVYDNGANTPPQIPVFSACGAEAAADVDREKLWAAILRSGVVFKDTWSSGIPRLCLVEVEREDGGVDFKVSHCPVVKQTKGCTSGKGPYGNEMYEDYLSDKSPISAEKDYASSANIYTSSGTYEFPGRSLSISGLIGSYSNHLVFPDLRICSGAWFRQMSTNGSLWLLGHATLYGNLVCRGCGAGAMFIESDLSGTGDVILTLDLFKAGEKKVQYAATVELRGDNLDFRGRCLVGCGKEPAADEAFSNQTLRVSAGQHLGGDLDSFTFDSLKVADTCTFAVTDSTTFEAANRGWCLMDGSTVCVSADKTVTANETVTFGGTVTKAGAGTLVLGGPSKAYDAENDAPVDTPNGAELVVAAGGLGATATDAFAGLSSLTFGAGTKYVASAANASGADLSAVALTVPAGGVPVEFTDIPENGTAITVATFATAEDAAKFVFVKPRGYIVTRSVEEVGGKFVLKAEIEKSGAVLIVR